MGWRLIAKLAEKPLSKRTGKVMPEKKGIDRDPKEVDLDWIRRNAFQLQALKEDCKCQN